MFMVGRNTTDAIWERVPERKELKITIFPFSSQACRFRGWKNFLKKVAQRGHKTGFPIHYRKVICLVSPANLIVSCKTKPL
jgi:hypothetical protein